MSPAARVRRTGKDRVRRPERSGERCVRRRQHGRGDPASGNGGPVTPRLPSAPAASGLGPAARPRLPPSWSAPGPARRRSAGRRGPTTAPSPARPARPSTALVDDAALPRRRRADAGAGRRTPPCDTAARPERAPPPTSRARHARAGRPTPVADPPVDPGRGDPAGRPGAGRTPEPPARPAPAAEPAAGAASPAPPSPNRAAEAAASAPAEPVAAEPTEPTRSWPRTATQRRRRPHRVATAVVAEFPTALPDDSRLPPGVRRASARTDAGRPAR